MHHRLPLQVINRGCARLADSAFPVALLGYVGVDTIEGMPLEAMLSVAQRVGATPEVLHRSNWLQMTGIYARRGTAKVIQGQSLGDVASRDNFVREAMGPNLSTLKPELSVAEIIKPPSPQPAGIGFCHIRPEAVFGCSRMVATLVAHRELILSGVTGRVVRATPSLYFTPLGAAA